MSEDLKAVPNKRKRVLTGVGILLILAVITTGYWFFFVRGLVSSDDARLDGDLIDIAPQIAGTLDRVTVKEGDRVNKGQILFALKKDLLEAAYSRSLAAEETARAQVAMAQAELEKVKTGPRPEEIQMAEAAAKKAEAALSLASVEWNRLSTLYKGRTVSGSERDKARSAYESALYAHQEAVKKLKLLQEGSRREDIQTAMANLEMAKARLTEASATSKQASVNLSYAEVSAPFDGLVVRDWQKPGAMLAAGRPVLTLFNPATLYLSANVEEKDLGRIQPGDPVDITVDAFPGLKMTGRLDKILLATNSEFSLIPSEGVSGTFIKVAQRVPLRITLDPHPDLPFGPGLSAEIKIHVGNQKSKPVAVVSE